MNKEQNQSLAQRVEIMKLRLNMAQEGVKHNMPMFSSRELTALLNSAHQLPESTEAERNAKRDLLKEALTEKLECLKQLKVADTEGLQQQLKALAKDQ